MALQLQQALAQRPQSTRQVLLPLSLLLLLLLQLPAAAPTTRPAAASPPPCLLLPLATMQTAVEAEEIEGSRPDEESSAETRLMSIRAAAAATACQSPWRLHWRSSATRFMPGSGQNVDGVDGKRCTCCRLILNVLATVE